MALVTLSRAEFLVILDILNVDRIIGLDSHSLIPDDRDTHLELIHEGIRQLESRGLVEIQRGRHIIERRLLELVSIMAMPQVVITTLRDRAGIGTQLYLHYQASDGVVEQLLPDEDHYSLGQLPNMASALDRIIRMLDLPTNRNTFPNNQSIGRKRLYEAQVLLESGNKEAALAELISSDWPLAFSESYLASQGSRILTGQVNIMAVINGQPGELLSLTVITGESGAWLLTPQPVNKKRLHIRQVNPATFRRELEFAYSTINQQTQELP